MFRLETLGKQEMHIGVLSSLKYNEYEGCSPHLTGQVVFMARKNFVAATALLLYLLGGLVKVYINSISLDSFLSYLL